MADDFMDRVKAYRSKTGLSLKEAMDAVKCDEDLRVTSEEKIEEIARINNIKRAARVLLAAQEEAEIKDQPTPVEEYVMQLRTSTLRAIVEARHD